MPVTPLRLIARCIMLSMAVLLLTTSAMTQWTLAQPAAETPLLKELPARPPKPTPERIAELIAQLGANEYLARREAERELSQIGLAAFDQVLQATDHLDPEIASACEYLLGRLTESWQRQDDPLEVQRRLTGYSQLSDDGRLQTINRLLKLPAYQGMGAICRICRFDPSPLVSKTAAVTAIDFSKRVPDADRDAMIVEAVRVLQEQYGKSQRPGAQWLQTYVDQQNDPAKTLPEWQRAIAAEQTLLQQQGGASNATIIQALTWNLLRVQLQAPESSQAASAIAETVTALADFEAKKSRRLLGSALDWLVEAEAAAAIDLVIEQHQDELDSKRGLYLIASIRRQQGNQEQAEQLANQALSTPADDGDGWTMDNKTVLDGRMMAGRWLDFKGYDEWAEREYRAITSSEPALTSNAAYAHWLLAESLQDRAEYDAAATVLENLNTAIEETQVSKRTYRRMADRWENFIPSERSVRSRSAYYRGLAHRELGAFDAEIQSLREAIEADSEDADVLIAMYRASQPAEAPSSDSDEVRMKKAKLREATMNRIRVFSREKQQAIEEEPSDPKAYNQWAWLIANTEGDYEKALRYSRASLRLKPDDAGYLDTLGRCYFAVGDYRQAVATQQEAIERGPHMRVMQRQLEQFKAALAEQEAAN